VRVFIIDDDEDARLQLRGMLTAEAGFEIVAEAADCAQALARCDGLDADVALVDYQLPGGDGLELLPVLRDRCPSMALVVYTGFGDLLDQREAERQGAAGFLEKGSPVGWIRSVLASVAGH